MGTDTWDAETGRGVSGRRLLPLRRDLAPPPPLTAAVLRESVPGRRRSPSHCHRARFALIRRFSGPIVGRNEAQPGRNESPWNELLGVASGVTAHAA